MTTVTFPDPFQKPAALVVTDRLNDLIAQRDELQKQIDRLQANKGQVLKFLDSLNGQVGPYAMQEPDVYAVLIDLWETYKASNPV